MSAGQAYTNITWVERINTTGLFEVTPTITANSAYASGAQIGGIIALNNVVRSDVQQVNGASQLCDITIIDIDSQNAAIDFALFKTQPTLVSVDHGTFNISDAQLVATSMGVVSAGSAYSAFSANSVSSTTSLNKIIQIPSTSAGANATLFIVAIIRAAATYTTASSLKFQFGFYID